MLKSLLSSKPTPTKKDYNFKSRYTFVQRVNEATKIMVKYQDKIPVIIEKGDSSSLPELEKSKLLINRDLTIGQLLYKLRMQYKLLPEEGIYIFINNQHIPSTEQKLNEVYEKHANEDKFLYISILKENVFG